MTATRHIDGGDRGCDLVLTVTVAFGDGGRDGTGDRDEGAGKLRHMLYISSHAQLMLFMISK